MKRRNLTLSLCLLAILAFSSIGFASWVITRPSAENIAEGQIIVDDATNGAYTLVVPTEMGQIIFGSPAEPGEYEEVWLNNTNHEEVLSQTISLQIEPAEAGKTFADIKDTVNSLKVSLSYISYKKTESGAYELDDDGNKIEQSMASNFTHCVNENYIVEPVLSYYAGKDDEGNDIWTEFNNGDTLAVNNAFNAQGICTIKVEFNWGSWGGNTANVNPYDYYNGQKYTAALANEAQENLHDLYENLKDVLYKLTIEG